MVQPMPFQSSGTATSDSPRTMKPNITTTGLRRNGRMENGRHQNGGGFSINSSGQNGEDWRQHEQHLDDGMVFDPGEDIAMQNQGLPIRYRQNVIQNCFKLTNED